MTQLNAARAAAAAACAMEDEENKLRRDLERYRFLLSQMSDPRAVATLVELMQEAEARLTALKRGGNGKGSAGR